MDFSRFLSVAQSEEAVLAVTRDEEISLAVAASEQLILASNMFLWEFLLNITLQIFPMYS